MKDNRQSITIICISLFLSLAFELTAIARDLNVPKDYPTVAQALAASDPQNDRIILDKTLVIKETIIINKPAKIVSLPPGARVEAPKTNGMVIRYGVDKLVLEGITFSKNQSGILVESNCTMDISQCKFEKNADRGIFILNRATDAGKLVENVSVTLNNCLFDGNRLGFSNIGQTDLVFKAVGSTFNNHFAGGLQFENMNKNDIYLENCNFNSNYSGGLRLSSRPADLQSDSTPAMEESKDYKIRAILKNCRIASGRYGITMVGPADVSLSSCSVTKSNEDALRSTDFNSKTTDSQGRILTYKNGQTAQITLNDCTIADNQTSYKNVGRINLNFKSTNTSFLRNAFGVRLESDARNVLDFKGCVIKGDWMDGLYLSSLDPCIIKDECLATINMEDCEISDNNIGIHQTGTIKVDFTGKAVKILKNRTNGVLFRNNPAVQAHASLMDSTISQNKFEGVLIQGPAHLVLNSCNLINNGSSGVSAKQYDLDPLAYRDGQLVRTVSPVSIEAKQCRFDKNYWEGLTIGRAGSYQLDQCLFTRGVNGISMPNWEIKKDSNLGSVRLVLNDTQLTSNSGTGINNAGYNDLELIINHSKIFGNPTGIALAPAKKESSSIGLLSSSEIVGKNTGISLSDKIVVCLMDNLGWNKGSYNNLVAFSPQSCLKFSSSTLSPDAGKSITAQDAKYGYVWDTAWVQNLDPQKVIEAFSANENILSHHPPVAVKFKDLEKDGAKIDWSAALLSVGDSFAEQYSKKRSDIASEALEYFDTHPDSRVACLVFHNLCRDVLVFEDSRHLMAFKDLVVKYPNSAIADAICSELLMRGLNYAEYGGICDAFKKTCQVPTDTLAGIMIASLVTTADSRKMTRQELVARVMKTFEVIGEKYPEIQAKVNPGYTHFASLDNYEGLCLASRRCLLVSRLVNVARYLHVFGQYDQASQLFALASREAALFGPASKDAYYMPAQVYSVYSELRNMLKNRNAMDMKKILGTCKGTTLTTQVSYRAYRYHKFYSDIKLLKPLNELNGSLDIKKLQDEELKLCLNDIRDLIQMNAETSFLRNYSYTYMGEVAKAFELRENVAALAWLDDEVAKINKSTVLEDEYNDCMVQIFRSLGDKTKEADFLARSIKMGAKSKYAKAAYERLTDLYLDFWKLPDKAAQMQQAKAKAYPGTEDEYKARLRTAKIYYEDKKFSESIFELTKLIGKLPKNYAKEPARTMLGLAYIGTQCYDEARNQFVQVINVDKGEYREKCLYLMGYSYICEQKYQEAVKPFNDLIRFYPASAYASQASDFLKKINTIK